MTETTEIRTRFAPSPSGHLHVGGARTALFCWAYARRHGGRFVLRIEDTDQKRSSDAASMAFLEDLKWLGIEWDEGPEYEGCGGGHHGPYFQSQRVDIYNRYLDQLIAEGKAYRAFETAEELEAARAKAREAKTDYRYDRAALKLDDATIETYLSENRPHVVRLRTPDVDEIVIHDELLGDVTVGGDEIDDFVIRKADGYPTYHFAVVVDDELMGITHVLRGQEHLKNTARHMLIQDALGFRRPQYLHMSLTMNVDGSKMSKRDKDKALRRFVKDRNLTASESVDAKTWQWWHSEKDNQLDLDVAEKLAAELGIHLPEINVDDFRRAGYLPEVMVNFLALLGWSPGGDVEKFDADFLVENFNFERMIKSPSKFDRDKLMAFNLDALQAMDAEEFHRRLREHAERYHPEYLELGEDRFRLFAECNQARSKTLEDPFISCRFFLVDDDAICYQSTKTVRKALVKGEVSGFAHLENMKPVLAEVGDWSVSLLEQAVEQYAQENAGGNLGKVAQPLRVAVTGGTVSPGIFETLAILGRESVLSRIDHCLSQRETIAATK
ncbi:MAG: glutamate--tRNA ligase [Phycisphaerales bacterium]|nr:MAG: glutamate--tRNA ligase [Phycisphaerales bacterium]